MRAPPGCDGRLGRDARIKVHDRLQLATFAQLGAAWITAAEFAATRGRTPVAMAVSDERVRAVDDVRHAHNAGLCLAALRSGIPVGVPDINATAETFLI
jgi:hypothetical protein